MSLRRIVADVTGLWYGVARRVGLETRASRQAVLHEARDLPATSLDAVSTPADGGRTRILLLGNGVAEGSGTRPGEAGFAGHLAQSLSDRTGRTVEVTTLVGAAWDLPTLFRRLQDEHLQPHDALVVSAAYRPQLAEVRIPAWQAYTTALKGVLIEAAGPGTAIRILSLPWRDAARDAPVQWGGAFGNRVIVLAETAEATLRGERRAVHLRLRTPVKKEEWVGPSFSAQSYRRWADQVAAALAEHLAALPG